VVTSIWLAFTMSSVANFDFTLAVIPASVCEHAATNVNMLTTESNIADFLNITDASLCVRQPASSTVISIICAGPRIRYHLVRASHSVFVSQQEVNRNRSRSLYRFVVRPDVVHVLSLRVHWVGCQVHHSNRVAPYSPANVRRSGFV
jgi:hypothetical protein